MNEYMQVIYNILTPEEWEALVFMLLPVIGFVETAKRVFFIRMTKIRRKRWIYGISYLVGIIAGYAGYLFGSATIPIWFWVFSATLIGPASNMAVWGVTGVIAWKFPKLALALKGKKIDSPA